MTDAGNHPYNVYVKFIIVADNQPYIMTMSSSWLWLITILTMSMSSSILLLIIKQALCLCQAYDCGW